MPGPSRPIRIGRYVLHGELAAGGMASVHFGRLLGTGGFAKTVAIKRLHRQFARDPKFRESILEEGRLAARIRHPNVVPPLDVLSEASELLLVMEYVHGESLSKLLRIAWPADEVVPVAVSVAIMSNTLHGLHAAHEAKDEKGRPLDIVHRDVSPQNILVGVDGIARVIDFGIAKAVTTQGESTSTGVIKGKVPYLAPEQLEGEPATRRTDVYAASVCLWEVLAGHRLFHGEDDSEILRKILGMRIEPPSAYNPTVPPALDDIVLRGLARKPDQRWATAREMALALEEVVHPATASVVGAWCERLAIDALANRAAQLGDVEASDRTGGSSRPPAPMELPPASQRPPPRSKPPPPLSKPPPPPRPPPAPNVSLAMPTQQSSYEPAPTSMTFGSQTVSAPAAQLSQMPDSQRVSAPPPPTSAPMHSPAAFAPTILTPEDQQGPPSTQRGQLRPPPAGALKKPALEIPNVEWLPQQDPPAKIPVRFSHVLGVLFVLGLIVLFACLPMIARSMILSGAQERGIALDLGRVEVSRRSIKLIDVRARTNDLPGVALTAPAIEIELSRFQPSRIAFADVSVEVEGTYAELSARIDKFRATRESKVLDWASDVRGISVASGRIDWKNAFGPGTHAVLENVAIDSDRLSGRALGEDYHLTAPLVTLRSGQTTLGPWYLEAQKRPTESTTTLKLDPSGTYPATVTWVSTELDAVTLTFAVPRVALANIRLPSTLFGPHTTAATKIEVRGELTLAPRTTPGRPLNGRVTATGTAIAIFPAATPIDVMMDLPVTGDGTKPIALDRGTVALAATEGGGPLAVVKLLGSLDITALRIAFDVGGKSTPLACSGKGETKVDARITLVNDKAADTRLAFDANPVCTPKALVAK